MFQSAGDLRFPQEAPTTFLVFKMRLLNALERHLAMELLIQANHNFT
jgi:hypothetical protein